MRPRYRPHAPADLSCPMEGANTVPPSVASPPHQRTTGARRAARYNLQGPQADSYLVTSSAESTGPRGHGIRLNSAVRRHSRYRLKSMNLLVPAALKLLACLLALAALSATARAENDSSAEATDREAPRVALVLSGGGARGFAQVGVLREFEDAGIEVDLIVGTSIGAIVGGMYAAGYTAAELDSIVRATAWDKILAVNEENQRSDQFLDQKQENDRSLITLRFDNFRLIIPEAVSSGFHFKEYISELMWNARYHAGGDFNKLRIPYRAVATDLVAGRSVVLDSGDLVTAMRASAAIPLLYTPIKLDSMILVDGGLLANIPVRAARELNPHLIIAVNTTSPLLPIAGLNTPWAVADQAVTAMIRQRATEDRLLADILIEPILGDHASNEFRNIDSLIDAGRRAARQVLPELQRRLRTISDSLDRVRPPRREKDDGIVVADLGQSNGKAQYTPVDEAQTYGARIESVWLSGFDNATLPDFDTLGGRWHGRLYTEDLESDIDRAVTEEFRRRRIALADVAAFDYDDESGVLNVVCRPGYIRAINISGNQEVDADQIIREAGIAVGRPFNTDEALAAWRSLLGSELFSEVTITPFRRGDSVDVNINVRERGSQFLRLGVRVDDERNTQGGAEFSDLDLFRTGLDLDVRAAGGTRNFGASIELSLPRLFNTAFTSGISLYTSSRLYRLYGERILVSDNRYERERSGEEWFDRYGATASFGRRLSKTATFSAQFRYEFQRAYRAGTNNIPDFEPLATIKFGLEFDSRDRVDFARSGRSVSLAIESSIADLNNDLSFAKATAHYEQYFSSGLHTLRPRFSFGFADLSTPRPELFSIGGQNDFLGYRENEDRGSQMALASLEYRVKSPIAIFFDTYLTARYDIGSIWRRPTEIRVSQLKHGIGAGVGFDSPLGPARFMLGRSFFFTRSPDAAVFGPLLAYFMIGVPL